jgi:hypothetical protein
MLAFMRMSPAARMRPSSARRSAGDMRLGSRVAIWPEPRVEAGRQKPTPDMPYTTAYIELMFTAIRVHGITDEHQSKKELLVDWYKEQAIEEEPISKNLAEAMATLVRHPKSQRGGAKRMIGPDLRETG